MFIQTRSLPEHTSKNLFIDSDWKSDSFLLQRLVEPLPGRRTLVKELQIYLPFQEILSQRNVLLWLSLSKRKLKNSTTILRSWKIFYDVLCNIYMIYILEGQGKKVFYKIWFYLNNLLLQYMQVSRTTQHNCHHTVYNYWSIQIW